ncbi:transmembrane protease serine 2-like [Bicyclus anynana]|uniref:Transmembrane protease serine 2-like n=1 Tax=Bicyclus anynana TaxID=110368 RepID=A0ABM3M5M4_BICAN|nr:transmembrane protease serine 2-like [Bicyclus anynana]
MYVTADTGPNPKFTRGEKCIVAHLILTIAVTIVLLIVYLAHIFVSDHSGSIGAFDTRRSLSLRVIFTLQYFSFPATDHTELRKVPIGSFYFVNVSAVRSVCNTLLLTPEWSASAGHCVALRSDPHLSYLLFNWRIKYPYDDPGLKILKSIVHPHFNRDSYDNNVGLMQHRRAKGFEHYIVPQIKSNSKYDIKRMHLVMLSWDHAALQIKGKSIILRLVTLFF